MYHNIILDHVHSFHKGHKNYKTLTDNFRKLGKLSQQSDVLWGEEPESGF
jgi:hypothetical protein